MVCEETMLVNRATCRACGAATLSRLIKFDGLPVAGAYMEITDPFPDPVFPLSILRCDACDLVQLRESVQAGFYRRYSFASGVADGYRRYLELFAQEVIDKFGPGTSVLEVGCSDGTLLKNLSDGGLEVTGFEPARALSQAAQQKGLSVINDYFNPASTSASGIGRASAIVIRHVLEHIDDFEAVFAAIERIALPDCTLIIEVPDLHSTVTKSIFSNFYHIHPCYFDVLTITGLLKRYGWKMQGSGIVDVFGGSLLVWANRDSKTARSQLTFEQILISAASSVSAAQIDTFTSHWKTMLESTRDFFANLNTTGKKVAGYGAAERTTSLIGMAGLNRSHITALFDRNPNLVGKAIPGSRIPILHPDRIRSEMPDYIAVFAQSFEDEIIRQQVEYLRNGGKFISLKHGNPRLIGS